MDSLEGTLPAHLMRGLLETGLLDCSEAIALWPSERCCDCRPGQKGKKSMAPGGIPGVQRGWQHSKIGSLPSCTKPRTYFEMSPVVQAVGRENQQRLHPPVCNPQVLCQWAKVTKGNLPWWIVGPPKPTKKIKIVVWKLKVPKCPV